MLPAAVAELQLEFQAHGKADYVEVALRALQALGTSDEPTDLALAFDYRVQHILVDEFQDTSFAQLDLLERLTAGWRRAMDARCSASAIPCNRSIAFARPKSVCSSNCSSEDCAICRLEPLRLEANFRSTPAVVDWVNSSFPEVLAPANDAEQGAVRYSPSTAALDRDGGGVVTSCVHRQR